VTEGADALVGHGGREAPLHFLQTSFLAQLPMTVPCRDIAGRVQIGCNQAPVVREIAFPFNGGVVEFPDLSALGRASWDVYCSTTAKALSPEVG
jgi:hypothetical protein